MQPRGLISALLSVSIATLPACGGGKKGSTGPALGGEGDDPATPFHDAAVKATLGNAPGKAECGVASGTTMGAHFQAQKQALRGEGVIVEESFRCTARPDNRWDCEWAVAATSDNPCAGEGGGGFVIMATVGPDGSVDANDVHCVAPG